MIGRRKYKDRIDEYIQELDKSIKFAKLVFLQFFKYNYIKIVVSIVDSFF